MVGYHDLFNCIIISCDIPCSIFTLFFIVILLYSFFATCASYVSFLVCHWDKITQGGSSCGFFKWCDDQQLRTSAPLQASSQYQTAATSSGQNSSKRSSSSCFKCGQENHWAKDCPNQSSDPYPDKGGRTLTSASSLDACFKCGKAGHWSRDCPTANCGAGTVASHVKSSSTLGSWNSHRY